MDRFLGFTSPTRHYAVIECADRRRSDAPSPRSALDSRGPRSVALPREVSNGSHEPANAMRNWRHVMTQQPESTERFIARGVVAADPLEGLPIGASLSIDPIVYGSSDATAQPQAVKNWGFFDGAILALGLKGRTDLDMTGTAVMIAPGLAVTAAHVLRDSLTQFGAGDRIPYCLGICPWP